MEWTKGCIGGVESGDIELEIYFLFFGQWVWSLDFGHGLVASVEPNRHFFGSNRSGSANINKIKIKFYKL